MVRSSDSCQSTSQTFTSSALPFTDRASISRVDWRNSGGRASTVLPVVMIWQALARPAMRAAVLTVSPKTSFASSMAGPKWKPTRMASLMPRTGGRSSTRCCMELAASMPASALSNTAITSSPMVLTTRPLNCSVARVMRLMQRSTACSASLSPSFS
jgi:hypothetical protein